MSDDDTRTAEAPTRRDYVKYGGAVVGGGLLAGCAGQSDSGSTPESTSTETETETTTTDDGPYTVEMFPVGEVEFEEVPETWYTWNVYGWADMAVALGQANGSQVDDLSSFQMWYDLLDIEVNSGSPTVWHDGGWDKEVFYELDPDVFLLDPNWLKGWDENFEQADIDEIEENVAPLFGSYNRTLTSSWQGLEYLENAPTMMEAFEKLGEAFQQQERVQAMRDLHAEVHAKVDAGLEGTEPPEIGLIGDDLEKGDIYVVRPTAGGSRYKHYRDLNVVDAFVDEHPDDSYVFRTDYEGILEVDPDHLIIDRGLSSTLWDSDAQEVKWDPTIFREQIIQTIEKDPIGQELTAVQNGNVHPGGMWNQGPLVNLFQLEFTAQHLYPEQFGEFPFETYPEVPEENRLFDRQRVVDIVNGDI